LNFIIRLNIFCKYVIYDCCWKNWFAKVPFQQHLKKFRIFVVGPPHSGKLAFLHYFRSHSPEGENFIFRNEKIHIETSYEVIATISERELKDHHVGLLLCFNTDIPVDELRVFLGMARRHFLPVVLAITKCDLNPQPLPPRTKAKLLSLFNDYELPFNSVETSGRTGLGVHLAIRKLIDQTFMSTHADSPLRQLQLRVQQQDQAHLQAQVRRRRRNHRICLIV